MKQKYKLTAMLVFKNEARYLKEWLDYHIILGVQQFYLYDNESDDNPLEILQWYINQGFVTYYILPGLLGRDSSCWPHRKLNLDRHGEESTWMMFTDIDEFLCLNNLDDNLHEVMDSYDKFAAIAVRSINFGNNNLAKYSNELVIKRFFRREVLPSTFKSIAKPQKIKGCFNGHTFILDDGTVDVMGKKINPENKDWVTKNGKHNKDRIYINHYRFKSTEEFFGFKNKNPQLVFDNKFFSERIFNRDNSDSNKIVAKKIQFFIPFLENNFVQNEILEIKKFYNSKEETSLQRFLNNYV